MIPWVEWQAFSALGLTWQVWGLIVAAGVLVAIIIAARRAKRLGLPVSFVWDAAFWLMIGGLVGARFFHALFYDPTTYRLSPMRIFQLWEPGFSMFGAWLGGMGALAFFSRLKHVPFFAYADLFAWSAPFGIAIGRLGCFLIHDHPGVQTSFFLGVRYPDGVVRHDLGLYLSLAGWITAILFFLIDRRLGKAVAPGFWLGVFFLSESVIRLMLDPLRIGDVRWFGWTPAQWVAIAFGVAGCLLVMKKRPSMTKI